MREQDRRKLAAFLERYAAILELDGAYTDDAHLAAHRDAAENLFEQSRGFIDALPWGQIRDALDVGLGYAMHCREFARRGARTTGVSVHVTGALRDDARRDGYTVAQMDMHFLDFPDDSFDLVWSNHSLEHSFSPLFALHEWLRVLRPGGWLAVSVPPHKSTIVSGHFCTGWSVGQLMYMLGVSGYDIEGGAYVQQGYNVRALVRKPSAPVDPKGLSWMHVLRERLPEGVRAEMIEHPRSLGRCAFEGALLEVKGGGVRPAPARS